MELRGRKKKISTEALMDIIKRYLTEEKYITKLKKVDLVNYSKKIGYTNLVAQDFIRNEEIKVFIDEYNLNYSNPTAYKINDNYNEINLHVDTIVNTFHNNKKAQKTILETFNDNYYDLVKAFNSIKEEKKILVENLKEKECYEKELLKEIEEYKSLIKEYKLEFKMIKKDIEKKKREEESKFIANALKYLITQNCCAQLSKNDIVNVLQTLKLNKNTEFEEINYKYLIKDIEANSPTYFNEKPLYDIDENLFD